jgi:hypothetical protein
VNVLAEELIRVGVHLPLEVSGAPGVNDAKDARENAAHSSAIGLNRAPAQAGWVSGFTVAQPAPSYPALQAQLELFRSK